MKLTAEQFVTVVRALPLSANQLAAAEAAFGANAPNDLPKELIRREVLTEFQARLILAGRGAELTVGRYVLLAELGAGGMGTVFKARDTAMDRVVALKLIRDERLANPAALARFQQEVRAAARLAHPNIVRAYDAGTADGRHFLVTELVSGYDLGHELARRGALPAGEACEFARQAAVGLQHAYEQGLTHRDIKPSNLLFGTADRTVKVADFGLARVGGAGANGLTADGSVMGTPDYIAPEQASSATSADIRSDLYSLGCTLYHFLTGHVPFPADSAYAKLLAHSREEPEPLDDACPGLNPALIEVVRKLMAKNPAERYQTPLEAAEALIPFCPKPRTGTTSVVSRPATAPPVPVAPQPVSASNPVVLPTPVPSATAVPEAFAVPVPHPAPKSNKVLALAGIGGGVLALVVLIVVLTRGGNTNTNTNNNEVKVAVPVSVSVNLDDWAKAREPGVILILDGKERALADFAKLELPPGHHVVVAKKDGKELEARAFDVKESDAGKALAARSAAMPDPEAAPSEVRRWTVEGQVTELFAQPDGRRFGAAVGGFRRGSVTGNRQILDNATRVILCSWDRAEKLLQCSTTAATGFGLMQKDDYLLMYVPGPYANDNWHLFGLQIGNFPLGHDFSRVEYWLNRGGHGGGGFEYVTAALDVRKEWLYFLRSSPDGRRLAYATADYSPDNKPMGQVRILSVEITGRATATVTERTRVDATAVGFDPSGERVVSALKTSVKLWDEKTGTPVREYVGAKADVECVAMAESGSRVAAGDVIGTVYAWKADAKEPLSVCKGHKGKVNAVGVTNDGARVVSAGEDGTVRVWDATTGKELHQYKHDGPVYALAMSPGGKRVLTGGADKTIRLWQLPP